MMNWFIIEFKYFGELHFANVFEYGTAPTLYHVQFINLHAHDPKKIVLKKTEEGIELSELSPPVRPELVNLIISKIEEHLANSTST